MLIFNLNKFYNFKYSLPSSKTIDFTPALLYIGAIFYQFQKNLLLSGLFTLIK